MTEWIKICGITTTDDALMIAESGATAIGLNFFPQSKRYISPATARPIRDAVADDIDVVGVFVNSSATKVAEIVEQVGLNVVQFHGDETPEAISQFQQACPDILVVRAFRVGDDGLGDVEQSIEDLRSAGVRLSAILLDAHVAGEYGGTGRQIDASLLQQRPKGWPPLILAGGLTPVTVAAAQAAVAPWGIDTASGVEDSPGVKSREKVAAFVAAINVKAGRMPAGV